MDLSHRPERLAARFDDLGVDAFLCTRLSNVWWLTGFSGSNGQALTAADGSGVFFTDGRYEEQATHEVAAGFRRDVHGSGLPGRVASACSSLGVARVAFEAEAVSYRLHGELTDALAGTGIELVPVDGAVERLRWVKEPWERAALRSAQAIADEAFERATETLAAGVTEKRVAAGIEAQMRIAGADRVAFETIVAFGESAAEPHHAPTDRPLAAGELVKMDFGCVIRGYHSDMTRTVALGEPSGRLREVYEVVRRAQQAGVEAVRAGVAGPDVDRAARAVVEEAGFGAAFSHSLGHGVGLDVHEGPYLRAGGSDVLPEGAVVTVEPGIYLPGEGGVRIEDMVEVTATGAEVLPRAPKELIVL